MKQMALLLLMVFSASSINAQPKTVKILYEKNYAAQHKDWKLSSEATITDIGIGYNDMKEPIQVTWKIASDSSGCLRIGYLKLETKNSESKIKISDLRTSPIACHMKWESKDQRRFESMIISGKYSTYKGIKQYTYSGKFVQVDGNGEYKISKFETK